GIAPFIGCDIIRASLEFLYRIGIWMTYPKEYGIAYIRQILRYIALELAQQIMNKYT
ncbi:hypothetical protein ACJX0J_011992, partial [Zea mays]